MARAWDIAVEGILQSGKIVEPRRKDVIEDPNGVEYEVSTSSLMGIKGVHHMLVTHFGKGHELYDLFEVYSMFLKGKDIHDAYIDDIDDHLAFVKELANGGNPRGLSARVFNRPAHREDDPINDLEVRADVVRDRNLNVYRVSTSRLPIPFWYDETLVTHLPTGKSEYVHSPHEKGLAQHILVLEGLKEGSSPLLYRA